MDQITFRLVDANQGAARAFTNAGFLRIWGRRHVQLEPNQISPVVAVCFAPFPIDRSSGVTSRLSAICSGRPTFYGQ